jgi:hypothetical protein
LFMSSAERKRAQRSQETFEQRDRRRAANAARQRESRRRATENSTREENEARLAAQRDQQRQSRKRLQSSAPQRLQRERNARAEARAQQAEDTPLEYRNVGQDPNVSIARLYAMNSPMTSMYIRL